MISTLKGDLTRLDFDIIVNAANEQLAPGGGVCGAIFRAAGPELITACEKLGGCPCGQARITSAYRLPSQVIIHTVGPRYIDGNHQESQYLEAAYWNSLSLAYDYMRNQHLKHITIGFPCISTGIFGYPKEEACQIAVHTVKELMETYNEAQAMDVVFVCFGEEDYLLYKKELNIR